MASDAGIVFPQAVVAYAERLKSGIRNGDWVKTVDLDGSMGPTGTDAACSGGGAGPSILPPPPAPPRLVYLDAETGDRTLAAPREFGGSDWVLCAAPRVAPARGVALAAKHRRTGETSSNLQLIEPLLPIQTAIAVGIGAEVRELNLVVSSSQAPQDIVEAQLRLNALDRKAVEYLLLAAKVKPSSSGLNK